MFDETSENCKTTLNDMLIRSSKRLVRHVYTEEFVTIFYLIIFLFNIVYICEQRNLKKKSVSI